MSNKEYKETKDSVPKIEDTPVDIISESTSPSGSACTCKSDKRDVSCLLHGG
jgi:hypothetical protein